MRKHEIQHLINFIKTNVGWGVVRTYALNRSFMEFFRKIMELTDLHGKLLRMNDDSALGDLCDFNDPTWLHMPELKRHTFVTIGMIQGWLKEQQPSDLFNHRSTMRRAAALTVLAFAYDAIRCPKFMASIGVKQAPDANAPRSDCP